MNIDIIPSDLKHKYYDRFTHTSFILHDLCIKNTYNDARRKKDQENKTGGDTCVRRGY